MKMMKLPQSALCLLLAAGPAAAQTSGCVRDAAGALICAARPAPYLPNASRRIGSTRDLSAAAAARGRAQAEALRDSQDQHRREANARAADRRGLACPASPPPLAGSPPSSARPCH
jgi:hypothetical protein